MHNTFNLEHIVWRFLCSSLAITLKKGVNSREKKASRVQDLKAFLNSFSIWVEEEKEAQESWEWRKKRRRRSGGRNEEDNLSDLPYGVLLHIMEFLSIRQVVQSSVLSKRWKNIWKSLATLSFKPFNEIHKYNRSLSHVLSNRDHYVSLHNLHLTVFISTAPKLLNDAIKYVALHHLQKLTLYIDFKFKEISNSFVPLLFNCQSLTFLEIFISSSRSSLKLPPSLLLPSLETFHLSNVTFLARDNDCVEPFSTCTSLTTLMLRHSMHH